MSKYYLNFQYFVRVIEQQQFEEQSAEMGELACNKLISCNLINKELNDI